MREQELEMLQREKEAEHFKTWEEQEDNFHLQQAKLRYVGGRRQASATSLWARTREPCLPQSLATRPFHCLSLLPWLVPLALQGATHCAFPVPTPTACTASCPLLSLSLSQGVACQGDI